MTRLIRYAIAIGGALVLLCAGTQQKQPTVTPDGIRLSAGTAIPTSFPIHASLPRSLPSIEPASQAPTRAPTITAPDPSVADLAIQVFPGETSIYTLTLRNLGPDPATDIVITDILPSGVTLVWTQPVQPVCRRQEHDASCDLGDLRDGDAATVTLDLSIRGGEPVVTGTRLPGVSLDLSWPTCAIEQNVMPPYVTCHLNNLQPGAETQMRIGFTVDSPVTETLVHTATTTANEADPDRSNNRATATTTVKAARPMVATAVPTTTDLVLQADGPSSVVAGQPFTYTYTITNRGERDATGVRFEDAVPSDLNIVAYAPGLPRCEQQGDAFACRLRTLDSSETVTFTLVITGHGAQPLRFDLDPLLPGWPICFVVKERTWQHIVYCEFGVLGPGQAARVQLVLVAIGTQERTTINTASVVGSVTDLNPMNNTSSTTIPIQVSGTPGGD